MRREYLVVGNHAVAGHLPGEKFRADYSREHEEYLIVAGHVVRVGKHEKAEPKAEENEGVKHDG